MAGAPELAGVHVESDSEHQTPKDKRQEDGKLTAVSTRVVARAES